MSISFSRRELLNIAIGIEQRGIAFYDVMAKSAEADRVRQVFQYLVDMEHHHVQVFQAMLAEVEKPLPGESHSEEYAAYLGALIDSAVFTDDAMTSETVTRLSGDIEAVELAISLEKDSILFYYEMRDIAPRTARQALDKIIAEEKSHLGELSLIKKELTT